MKHLSGVMHINCAYLDDSSTFDDLEGRQNFQKIGLAYKDIVSATHVCLMCNVIVTSQLQDYRITYLLNFLCVQCG